MTKKIKLDKNNVRVHDDDNKNAIEKSLKELGAGRSVLIDSENMLIAGNGVFEQAKKLKIPVKIIESNGKELIAIKRTDLKTDSDKRKALAIADNKINDMSFFDFDKLKTELEQLNDVDFDLEFTGFKDFELGFLDNFTAQTPQSSPAGDNEQVIETDANVNNEYHDMPEYEQESIDNFRIIVHFRSIEDKLKFSSILEQSITEKTNSLWFPKMESIVEKDYECEAK